MRKWLLEETGEIRIPNIGESYLYDNNQIETAAIGHSSPYPILRVTEITDWHLAILYAADYDHPLSDRFDEWNW